ncbi:MAG: sigma-70 family RNA polymerase sigma factor [Acidobacteria bacterium]|nr:sigma-70 family RNA polymerase sigma factor [Acidobacteriota bacterium]
MDAQTTSYELIERFRSGDQEAFAVLYERYRARLTVLIHYRMGEALSQRYEVSDLLQEVFLRASTDLQRFEYQAPGSFFRWLARIAGHVIVDAARHEDRAKRDGGVAVRFRSESNPGGHEPVDSLTPSRVLREGEDVARLLSRLDALPEDYRTVILLSKFEGLATAAVAERMGRTREQVALLLHRALKRYRELT